MATRKWYQDPRIAVPVAVALIGLVGTAITVLGGSKSARPTAATEAPLTFPVVVIDNATGDHIAGARVLVDEQGVSVETDSQGRCTLSVRPGQGKLRVTVSSPGYRTQNVELTIFEGMDPARIRL